MTVAAPPATAPVAYCLCHARACPDAGLALDGVHRVVHHTRREGPGVTRLERTVLGTFDRDEALTIVAARRRARALGEHGRHRSASGISRDCELCLERGAHLDHIEDRRAQEGCAECETALHRAWSAKVGA